MPLRVRSPDRVRVVDGRPSSPTRCREPSTRSPSPAAWASSRDSDCSPTWPTRQSTSTSSADRFELQPRPLRMMLDVLVAEQLPRVPRRRVLRSQPACRGMARSGLADLGDHGAVVHARLLELVGRTRSGRRGRRGRRDQARPGRRDRLAAARPRAVRVRPIDRRRGRRRGRPAARTPSRSSISAARTAGTRWRCAGATRCCARP